MINLYINDMNYKNMNYSNSAELHRESLIQQLHELASGNQCDFDYDEVPYEESRNNVLDHFRNACESDESTAVLTDDSELEYTKKTVSFAIKLFKRKVIHHSVKELNCLAKEHKLKFHVPKLEEFLRNVSFRENELVLNMTLHKILLKFDGDRLSNRTALERAESLSNVCDFLNSTFEQLVIKYSKSHAYKKHLKYSETKNKKYLPLLQALGNERHSLFYPNFIRNQKSE